MSRTKFLIQMVAFKAKYTSKPDYMALYNGAVMEYEHNHSGDHINIIDKRYAPKGFRMYETKS